MRQYLFGALFVLLGSQVICEYSHHEDQDNTDSSNALENRPDAVNDRDTSSASLTSSEEDISNIYDGSSSIEKKQEYRHAKSYSYSGEDDSGNHEFDQYQPMEDDVAYWDSIYGTDDIPEFDVPPPIDGDSIFLDLDDLADSWDDVNNEQLIIPTKRDAGESRSHISRTSSSESKSDESLRHSVNSDYQSTMSGVYRPNFYAQNFERGPKTSSGYQGNGNKRFYGSEGSDEMVSISNLDWPSKNVGESESGIDAILHSQGIAESELESAERSPLTLKTRSIISSDVADSLLNSKRKIIQAKKDFINAAADGGSKAEVSDALHSVIGAKQDFIDSVVSAKLRAIEGKTEFRHPATDFDSSKFYSADSHISGSTQTQSALQSVFDTKQKVIQSKKDLIDIAASGGSQADIGDAVYRTIEAKKDLIDSVASAKASLIGRKKEFVHSADGFDQRHEYSMNSKSSGSLKSQNSLQSVLDSKQKVIQSKKDLIDIAASGGSQADIGDAVYRTIEAKKDLIDSVASAKASLIGRKKEFVHSADGFDQRHEYSMDSKSSGTVQSLGSLQSVLDSKQRVIQAKKDLIHASAVGGRAELTDAVIGTLDAKKELVDSVLYAAGAKLDHGKKDYGHSTHGAGNIAENFHSAAHRRGGTSLNTKSKVSAKKHTSFQSGSTTSKSHHNVNERKHSSRVTRVKNHKSSSQSSLSASSNIAIGGESGVASFSQNNHRKDDALNLNEQMQSNTQTSGGLELGSTTQSRVQSSASSDRNNLAKTGNSKTRNSPGIPTIQEEKSSLHASLSGSSNTAIGGEIEVASSSRNNHREDGAPNLNKQMQSKSQILNGLELGSLTSQSGIESFASSDRINLAKPGNSQTRIFSGIPTIQDEKSSLHASLSGSSNTDIGGEIEVASSLQNNHREDGALNLNEQMQSKSQISTGLELGSLTSQSGIESFLSSDKTNLAKTGNSKTRISSGMKTIQNEESSLHASLSGSSNTAIEGEIGVKKSSSSSHRQKGTSMNLGKRIQSSGQISSDTAAGLTTSQSEVKSFTNSGRINSARAESSRTKISSGFTAMQDEEGALHGSLSASSNVDIGGEVGDVSSPSDSGLQKGGSLSLDTKSESENQISDDLQSGLITSQSEIDISAGSSSENMNEDINDSVALEIQGSIENSESSKAEHVSKLKVGTNTDSKDSMSSKITPNKNLEFGQVSHSGPKTEDTIEFASSSSESSSEETNDSATSEIEDGIENSEFSNTEHVSESKEDENTDVEGSINSKITLNQNLDLGYGDLKTEGGIDSGISTRLNTKTATIQGGGDRYATLDATEVVKTEEIVKSQSIEEECATGQCGISGKLHVDFNTRNKNNFHHEDELKNIGEAGIPQNLDLFKNDEEIMDVSIQSPTTGRIAVNTEVGDEDQEEHAKFADYITNFGTKGEDEKTVESDDEGGQYTKTISTIQNVASSDDDVSSESYFTEPEIVFQKNEEMGNGHAKEYQSVDSKSEHKFGIQTVLPKVLEEEEEENSIAVEHSQNGFVRTEVEGTVAQEDEEKISSAFERNSSFQVSAEIGDPENDVNYEDQSSTYDKQFGKHYSDAAYQHPVAQDKEKIRNFHSFDGFSPAHLPQDVELYPDDGTIPNGHCCLINLNVNCTGMTAFMKPECQQLNTNLWSPRESGTPITLWTIKTHLSRGQKLAIEMQNRAKWLCDRGFVPKLHTPAMLHLINNLASESTVEINQESEFSLFGTKLLQRRLSSDFDVTPNTFIEFLHHHAFRVIGTGLCHARPKRCPVNQMYRSFDGSCNHRVHATWGKCDTAFSRILPARYHDGVHQPPRSVTGRQLPNPRALSVHCFSRKNIAHAKLTLAVPQWGQLLSHDFAFQTADQTVEGGIQCCDDGKRPLSNKLRHHSCMQIEIPSDDKFYSKFGFRCMNFVRSMTVSREDCTLGSADQLNTVTSYLDASPVYGSNIETCDELRAFKGGEMLATVNRGRELLPTMTNRSRFCDVMSPSEVCYRAGDVRVNQNPQLALMQTVLVREHNRIARELTVLNPHWDDERVFHEARKIVIAVYQHITYSEWLPLVIGKKYCQKHRLAIRRSDTLSRDYNPRIKPATINSFTTAAFRLFHSMVDGNIDLCPANREISHTLRLSNHYFRPQIITRSDNFDDLLRGLAFQKMQKSDENFHPEITEYLFRSKNEFGMDLEALDIQRGRDHGLPSYNAYRKVCGLPRAKYFDDLITEISREGIEKLKRLYDHVDDIDLIVGLALETNFPDGIVGPVARCLIGEQFYRSKTGDRYFYSNADQPHSFTRDQFEEIKKASLARLICDNGDNIEEIQPQAFKLISRKNPLTCCGALPKINLCQWQELKCRR